jgi:predicted nucleic-acid-binding Zn-ribbon protein
MTTPTCPRCGGRFEEGYILDQGDHGSRNRAAWIEGPAERSFWVGLKLRGKARYPIVTHRCSQCGFLESYAPKC